ncbi:hypothetical protein CI105_00360 [Candidatus Izimaplasma bacterium ZiA1]|uniref:nitroreductase family protein n=1 Tax=Candidatus Izimoplasma sp. ZiA1 TaxID=2024899 RepID=UPI000BAA6D67|nr:hypothetical protein CI105_00360 [Candidatus Izimaplasma bacterium ZiA1]
MIDTILNRSSTRTYKNEMLKKNEIDLILEILKNGSSIAGPFNHKTEFTFSLNQNQEGESKKIGTYGFIKSAPAFIGGVCINNKESIIDFGFCFERVILDLTNKGFGTCWLGGTFKRKDYRSSLKNQEIIPALSPVGFRSEQSSIIEKLVRRSAKSNSRKTQKDLFKDYETLSSAIALDMKQFNVLRDVVQAGPSASNKQPWRVYFEDEAIHFYLERTPKYVGAKLGYDIQLLDIGIAISHASIALDSLNVEYSYQTINRPKEIPNNEYIVSIILK